MIIGPNGPVAIDLQVMPLLFDINEITDPKEKRWIITDLKSLSRGFLENTKGEK